MAGSLRTLSRSTLELAAISGILVRLYRAIVLGRDVTDSWMAFVGALVVAAVFLCGVLSWHLSNFPVRRWPIRVAAFVGVEVAAELGMSSVLIALGKEPIGSGVARWADWWPLAGQTLLERTLVLGGYAVLLAVAVHLVTRARINDRLA